MLVRTKPWAVVIIISAPAGTIPHIEFHTPTTDTALMFDDTADAIYRPRARGAGRSPLKTLVEPRRHPIYRQLLQAAPYADRAALKEMLALAAFLDTALQRQASELGAERRRGGGGDRRGRRHHGAAPCMTSTLHRLFSELASAGEDLFGPSASYEPAPLAGGVLERFARRAAQLSASPSLAFHGTPSANIPSILERGLLVPGNGNDVRVANGSALGVGIYTAQQPGASLGYCKGSSQMLALGVLDLASGGQALRRVGNVTVFFDAAHVVPIGIVSFKQHEVAMDRSHAARGTAPMNAAARARYQKAAVQTTAPASARRLPHTADAVKLAHRRAAGRKDKRATRQRHAARQLKHMVREGETTVAVDPLAPPARTAAQRAASQRRQREATRQQKRNTRRKGERKQQARAKRARTVMQRG